MRRLTYIDWLRNVSNFARVFIHASVPYMASAAPMWPLNEEGSYLFDFGVFETHLFVMEMFYVISGFMFGLEMSRKNVRQIAQNRGQRIVLPFVAGVALFTPIILMCRGFKNYPGYGFLSPDALMASYQQGWELGMENVEWPSFSHYYFFFLVGVKLSNRDAFLDNVLERSKVFLRVGIPLGVLAIVLQLWSQDAGHSHRDLIQTAAIVLGCASTHFLVLGLWGWFGRKTWKDSATLRYFTDASYWVYLSNMPLVMLWHVMLAPLDMSIYVKFPISLFGAFGMSMLTYEYVVRYKWVGAVLNKRRVRNPSGHTSNIKN